MEYLHKYGALNEYSEALFVGSEIYCQSPSKLNDPYECRPYFTFNGTREQIVESLTRAIKNNNPGMTDHTATANAVSVFLQGRHRNPETWDNLRIDIIRQLGNRIGMYCMSEKPDHILMWSHYANNHEGYCLIFEATDTTPVFGTAQQVNYSAEFPEVDFFNTPNDEQVDLMFLTKYTDWSYEAEWRIVNHETGTGLLKYPSELLKGVIFGMRMPDDDKDLIRQWLAKRKSPVKIYQAQQDEREYKVDITEIGHT